MKLAIVGAGGVGGHFGGLLARAGHEVVFIARGQHLRAIRANGLTVRSVHGDFEIPRAATAKTPDTKGVGRGSQLRHSETRFRLRRGRQKPGCAH